MAKSVLTWLKYSGWIMLLGGVLSIAHSCSTLFGAASTWASGTTVEGSVIQISKRQMTSTNGQRRHVESAIVQFTTAKGDVITITDKVTSTTAPYRIGEKVKVVYEADRPEAALITGSAPADTALSVFQGISGWIGLVMGGLLIVLAKLPWMEAGSRNRAG